MPAIWRSIDRFHAAGLVAVAAFGLVSSVALAEDEPGPPPNFHMLWDATGDTTDPFYYDPSDFGSMEFGTWVLEGGWAQDPGAETHTRTGWRYQGNIVGENWLVEWDCVANADPFVDATITVTNNSAAVQTYTMYMPLLIAPPIFGGTSMSGFVSAGVTDGTFDSATLGTTLVDPVFQGYIDTVAIPNATLWNPGYTLVAPTPFSSNSDSDSFLGAAGPAALAEIAVRLTFTLTPGDSASVTGQFDVVPGPGALAVFAVYGLVAGRRRRR
jgi:uncharacterized protein (TIGR03382 family)